MGAREPSDRDRVCVARIGAPHGIRGEVRLHAFTEDPMALGRYGALEAGNRSRFFTVEGLRQANGFLVARLSGIADRDAAQRVNNTLLFVPRGRLPALEEADNYYRADLIGLAVVNRNGEALGTVTAVENFGAGDLIEIGLPSGTSVLLPFTKDVVPSIDLAAGRLVADPPEGLIPGVPAG